MSAVRSVLRRQLSARIRQARKAGLPVTERDARQGGGKYTKPAPKVRRSRNRHAATIAKTSRKGNR